MEPPVRPLAARRLVTAAAVAYLVNCLWGTAVAVRLIRTKKLRVVHHGLFVVTATLTGVAATTPVWSRDRSALFLLPALVPLAVAPRTNPRSRAHWRVAVAAAPSYLGALLARGRPGG
ncbi:hypothetical protein [Curtobacterium sp. MCBA15_004]|uniref:hypothetical protein n=1 Tax=unclassified Curtobacterium TaxID=257496 RepID=UPI0008DC7A7F|nr:hypothetical protein [Curtobacterium sp. MCBA15_004]WIA96917.1 hypothetical protein QOL16_00575 [Curtobacterium sp. MCBA15_004]